MTKSRTLLSPLDAISNYTSYVDTLTFSDIVKPYGHVNSIKSARRTSHAVLVPAPNKFLGWIAVEFWRSGKYSQYSG